MKEKLWRILLFVLLILCCSSALAAADSHVIPLETEQTHALLLKTEENNYIVGGANTEAILQALENQNISNITAVIVPCDHEDHISAVQTLCDHFQVNALTPAEVPEADNSNLQQMEKGWVFTDSKSNFAFGVDSPIDDSICYQCDGSLLAFKATINEASVNVRDSASTSGKRVAKLNRGTLITVQASILHEKNELWYHVVLSNGTEGFIRSDLLQYASKKAASPATEEKSSSTNNNKSEKRYIGNKKSKVFHRPSCGSLPSGKNMVYFDSRSYAVSKGYKPCSNCDP